MSIENAYTGESITHSDGREYATLEPSKVDWEGLDTAYGKKTKATLARVAKAGEEIVTNPGSVKESQVTAKGGEVIFINELPGGKRDEYIPRDSAGNANGQILLADSYEAVGDPSEDGQYFRPKGAPVTVAHEAIKRPTVILNAWGVGQHQFLNERATLKVDQGKVTGIDKNAFDQTWSLTDASGNPLREWATKAGKPLKGTELKRIPVHNL